MYRYEAVGLAFYDATTSDISGFYKVRICCWRKYHFWGLTFLTLRCWRKMSGHCLQLPFLTCDTQHDVTSTSDLFLGRAAGRNRGAHSPAAHSQDNCLLCSHAGENIKDCLKYTPLPHTFMFSQETLGLQCKCEDIISQTIQLERISLVACMYAFNCFYCISKVF